MGKGMGLRMAHDGWPIDSAAKWKFSIILDLQNIMADDVKLQIKLC